MMPFTSLEKIRASGNRAPRNRNFRPLDGREPGRGPQQPLLNGWRADQFLKRNRRCCAALRHKQVRSSKLKHTRAAPERVYEWPKQWALLQFGQCICLVLISVFLVAL